MINIISQHEKNIISYFAALRPGVFRSNSPFGSIVAVVSKFFASKPWPTSVSIYCALDTELVLIY